MDLLRFKGKHFHLIENGLDLNYYIELLDKIKLGKNQNHNTIIDAFLEFVGDSVITVVKMYNDIVDDVVDLSKKEVINNLYLLGEEKGLFFDDDWNVSYGFVCEEFFAYILPNMLMFSANKEKCKIMASILDNYSLHYFGPDLRPDMDRVRKVGNLVQMKITLKDSDPEIWRRFVIKDTISFHELHNIIQLVMGWENNHVFQFFINDICIEGETGFCVDGMWKDFDSTDGSKKYISDNVIVKEFLSEEKQSFTYIYDLGDNWVHTLFVEKITQGDENTPFVLDGAQNCPPEDCGGIYGYEELLEIKKDPTHDLYEERIVEWLGEDFDPDSFDKQCINRKLDDITNWQEQSNDFSNIKRRKLGRNEPCYCGSGKKYKKCCLPKDMKEIGGQRKVPV